MAAPSPRAGGALGQRLLLKYKRFVFDPQKKLIQTP